MNLTCRPNAKERFEYLLGWDPEALKEYQYEGELLLHHSIGYSKIDRFAMVLKAGMDHHPENLGFLFQKDSVALITHQRVNWRLTNMAETRLGGSLRNVLTRLVMSRWLKRIRRQTCITTKTRPAILNIVYYLLHQHPGVLAWVGQEEQVERKRRRSS